MRRILLAIALTLLAFMASIVFATQRVEPVNELYVFGDSLSDTGTVFRATGGTYPPRSTYFQGRYSNGRVWVEYLADQLHLSSQQVHNFACGGATTERSDNSLVPGLLLQVESFQRTHAQTNSNALYVLWAGANDYLQGTSNATAPVTHIMQSITVLANIGAKRILIANLPDLGQLPSTRHTANAERLNTLTGLHNQGLRRSLKQLNQQNPSLTIVLLDTNTLYRNAIAHPAEMGFTNVTTACLSSAGTCSNPDGFLFWDGIHPTTTAHRIISEQAFTDLETQRLNVSHTTAFSTAD